MTDQTYKQTKGKLSLLTIPPTAITAIAKAMAFGLTKYKYRWSWRDAPDPGLSYTELLDAVQRHINAWACREETAADSGVHHLAHAGAGIVMLLDLITLGKGVDDRHPLAATLDLYDVGGDAI